MNNEKEWLSGDLETEVLSAFQPLYRRELTKAEIYNIANSLADIAELWIKFNWRIARV